VGSGHVVSNPEGAADFLMTLSSVFTAQGDFAIRDTSIMKHVFKHAFSGQSRLQDGPCKVILST